MKTAFDIELETCEPDDEMFLRALKAMHIDIVDRKISRPTGLDLLTYSSENRQAIVDLITYFWDDTTFLKDIVVGSSHGLDTVHVIQTTNNPYDTEFQLRLKNLCITMVPWDVSGTSFDEYLFTGSRQAITNMLTEYFSTGNPVEDSWPIKLVQRARTI